MEIDSVESDCITLKIVDNRNTSSVHKVKVNDIGATVCHYDMKKNIACWAFHNVDLRGEQSERNLLPDRLQISPTTPKKTSASTTVPPEDLRGKGLKYNFVETPHKFIIAELSIRKLGSSSVLII